MATQRGLAANATVAIVPLTADTIDAVARMHFEELLGPEGTALGPLYARTFVDWFHGHPEAIALAAYADQRTGLCGYVLGAPRDMLPQLYRALLPVVARAVSRRPWILVKADVRSMARARLGWLRRRRLVVTPDLPPPTMFLNAICVAASWRGDGVGQRLVREFEAAARARQMRSLRLEVLERNHTARGLYEQCGWDLTGATARGRLVYSRVLA